MGEIYYIKVKVLLLIIHFSDKLITSNGYISKSKKGDFLGLHGICLFKNKFFGVNVTN